MTNKEINAAYWREIEGQQILSPKDEALARAVLLAVNETGSLNPDTIFVKREVQDFHVPGGGSHLEVHGQILSRLDLMIHKCTYSGIGIIKITAAGIWVGKSQSFNEDIHFALAEAMVLEKRRIEQ